MISTYFSVSPTQKKKGINKLPGIWVAMVDDSKLLMWINSCEKIIFYFPGFDVRPRFNSSVRAINISARLVASLYFIYFHQDVQRHEGSSSRW